MSKRPYESGVGQTSRVVRVATLLLVGACSGESGNAIAPDGVNALVASLAVREVAAPPVSYTHLTLPTNREV